MSVSQILQNGRIADQFLPAYVASDVRNPMVADLDGGNYDIKNVATLSVGTASAPTFGIVKIAGNVDATGQVIACAEIGVDSTSNSTGLASDGTNGVMLLFPAAGGSAKVSDKVNEGQIYDTYFNPVPVQTAVEQEIVSAAGPINPAFNNTTIATLALTTIGADKESFMVYIDNLSFTCTTPGVGCQYRVFLATGNGGAYDSTKGCLSYITPVLTNGQTLNSGTLTLNLRSVGVPLTTIYLNVFQVNSAQSGQLTNIACTADVYASIL